MKATPPLSFLLLASLLLCSSLPLLCLSQQPSPPLAPTNPRLEKAYVALQAWKRSITADPKNLTHNWCGPYVCNYTGVYCTRALDDPCVLTVAGIDLNHGKLSGTLPEELGLLSDLALFHLNSNRFYGCLPESFGALKLLYELDVSNNRLTGPFPSQLLCLPSLKYLDLRYNEFYGGVPEEAFAKSLDAFFINHNKFRFSIPESIGNSTASVLVFANNKIDGCLPKSLGNLGKTLNQLVLLNSSIQSCIPSDIGRLGQLTVLDLSFNKLVGPLPASIGDIEDLEQLDVAHNLLSGEIPESICELPHLKNFTYSYNYICGVPEGCTRIPHVDDRENCIAGQPEQRTAEQCAAFLHMPPVHCNADGCIAPLPPPPPPPPY